MRKKRSSSDVLRQEMQQPLVLPDRPAATPAVAPAQPKPSPQANFTPTNLTNMNAPTNDDAAAKLKAAQETEAKLKQQVEDLQSKLKAQTTSAEQLQSKTESLTKELKDAKKIALELSAPSKAPAKTAAKTTAIVKKDSAYSALSARPTQSSEETALRRANTDIGWLD
jgi:predicted RNase H-like nuclease (RuvC/YqgF family)